jgi:dolichol-phosphate mannosyltransferase
MTLETPGLATLYTALMVTALPGLSVLVPVRNEADNIAPLVAEIVQAVEGRFAYEILYINDGSTDASAVVLTHCQRTTPALRVLTHQTACGQSTAVMTGVRHAQHEWIAVLDGDGQNDPADIPLLWEWVHLQPSSRAMAIGHRTQRQDAGNRKSASRFANGLRRRLLKDNTPDSGCGLKVLSRALFLELPYFDHMHRFMPALVLRAGGTVESLPVRHRARTAGVSKYNNLQRALVGIADLVGVWWLQRRAKVPVVQETSAP